MEVEKLSATNLRARKSSKVKTDDTVQIVDNFFLEGSFQSKLGSWGYYIYSNKLNIAWEYWDCCSYHKVQVNTPSKRI